jgi:hypothetical protein
VLILFLFQFRFYSFNNNKECLKQHFLLIYLRMKKNRLLIVSIALIFGCTDLSGQETNNYWIAFFIHKYYQKPEFKK